MKQAITGHHAVGSSIVRVHIHEARRSLGKFAELIEGRSRFGYRVVPGRGSLPGRSQRLASELRQTAARVLLVEDDPIARRTLVRAFLRDGWEVVSASTAADAQARPGAVDLALIDIGLPDDDGVELARRLLTTGRARRAALMSARRSRADRERASGVAPLYDKLMPLDHLLAALRAGLPGRELAWPSAARARHC
jgi:DNA-binding response OmpR family regulator